MTRTAMRIHRWICLALVSGLALQLAACAPSPTVPPTATSLPAPSSTPAPLSTTPSQLSPETSSTLLPVGLRLEESALRSAPALDPLVFIPVQASQEQVLAGHAADRERRFPDRLFFDQGNPALWAPWDGDRLVAVLLTAGGEAPEQTVQLLEGDRVVFSAPAGLPSPALPLQGLWAYDGHWALEILLSTPSVWAGEIFIDSELINEQYGYEDAFGFQLLAGKPFYFYQRDGQIGLSYDGQEVDLSYSQVPHYRCCSESVLNPTQAENMVAFFAERDGVWYYVEVGAFE